MRDISKIIVHCSDTPPDRDIGAAEIRAWHTAPRPKGNGWADIGYHFVIRRDGTLETGRPLFQAGAHCLGWNADSIGVCLVGGRKAGPVPASGRPQPEDNFTPAQYDALAALLRDLLGQFPGATVHGHREFAAKDCPCFDVQHWWSVQRYARPTAGQAEHKADR